MNDGFREARQNHPRKVEARHHGIIGLAPELVVSGIESVIENERRQSDHAHAHTAQTRARIGDQGNAWPSANELRANRERTDRISRSRCGARTNCEAVEKKIIFLISNFVSQSKKKSPRSKIIK
jgi:hypothetical protein